MKYYGITYPEKTEKELKVWAKKNCVQNYHLFDEVLSDKHYLSCDACGLVVYIEKIETKNCTALVQVGLTLYTVRKCYKNDKCYGKSHGSNDAVTTVCGEGLDENWFVTNNTFGGKIDCPKCLRVLSGITIDF